MESRRLKPLRAAVAPTAMPNAIMPGSTGSDSNAPRRKPDSDQVGLSTVPGSFADMGGAQAERSREHELTKPRGRHNNKAPASGAGAQHVSVWISSRLRLRLHAASTAGTRTRFAGGRHCRAARG